MNNCMKISYNDGSIHTYDINIENKIDKLPLMKVSQKLIYKRYKDFNPTEYFMLKDCNYITCIFNIIISFYLYRL